MIRKLFPLLLFMSITLLVSVAHFSPAQAAPCIEDTATAISCIPVLQFDRAIAPQTMADASDSANPYALIGKEGPDYAGAGDTVHYQIQLANYEAEPRTVTVTEVIPQNLELVTTSGDITYNPTTRQLSWQGVVAPVRLEYIRLPAGLSLPYIDLATYGVPNLCDSLPDCDETAVTFNLGINNHKFFYYGAILTEITVSPNGLLLSTDPVASTNQNRWLPVAAPVSILAGLWRDVDMSVTGGNPEGGAGATENGRWHVAILSGLLADHDVFYAQWHDAPAAGDPDNTARHAVALALGSGPYTGHIFYIYDNIAHPDDMIDAGYTIGLSDPSGARGLTFAFSDCCGAITPRGYPPAAGVTVHLAPVIHNPESSQTTLRYSAMVKAAVPETVVTTAVAESDSSDPAHQLTWSTHYLFVRELLYLPVIQGGSR